jgi:methanogenic corrinoid protein MtbC1
MQLWCGPGGDCVEKLSSDGDTPVGETITVERISTPSASRDRFPTPKDRRRTGSPRPHRAKAGIDMNTDLFIESLFSSLISGDRHAARRMVDAATEHEISPQTLAREVFWPTINNITTLYRNDQMTQLAQQYATRTLSGLIAQNQSRYEPKASRNRSICMFCGPTELDDLAARVIVDLLEADGYDVTYGGGNIAHDDIMQETHERRPDILLMFSSGGSDAPGIRQLIDQIRGINAFPEMQIVVGGGIFNRAAGLAEEIGADLWATGPDDLLEQLEEYPEVRSSLDDRTVGRGKATRAA